MAARRSVRGGRFCTGLAACAALLALAGAAAAGDGAQFDRTCSYTYVNKKVGDNEQWAITWSIYGDATGNVLKLDGSAPSFIECTVVGSEGENDVFDCVGADACIAPPCGGTQWSPIASGVSIPLSFFLPTGVDPLDPLASCEPVE